MTLTDEIDTQVELMKHTLKLYEPPVVIAMAADSLESALPHFDSALISHTDQVMAYSNARVSGRLPLYDMAMRDKTELLSDLKRNRKELIRAAAQARLLTDLVAEEDAQDIVCYKDAARIVRVMDDFKNGEYLADEAAFASDYLSD
tara:strand:- start:232 stop:669 length:438 start_codon:yes stop_codon:yes gene_type:complete